MIRKYNYTGRVKIPRSLVKVKHRIQGKVKSFGATLDLAGLGFPPDAKVYVEPYFKASFMRFDFGTVGRIVPPKNTELTEIPTADRVLYRIKVVDESNVNGLILGHNDEITPELDESVGGKLPLLPVDFNELGNQIWRLDFRNDGPVLEVNGNGKIDRIREIVKDSRFLSLVYPEVVRQVVTKILNDEELSVDDPSGWLAHWLKFFNDILNVHFTDKPNASRDQEELVEAIVDAFCKKNDVIFHLMNSYGYSQAK